MPPRQERSPITSEHTQNKAKRKWSSHYTGDEVLKRVYKFVELRCNVEEIFNYHRDLHKR